MQLGDQSWREYADRVKFVIQEAIEQGEKEEGVTYPDDREPGHDFDGFTLK